MSDDEQKPMLISQDLLEQVLRNQKTQLETHITGSLQGQAELYDRAAETTALLERLKTS